MQSFLIFLETHLPVLVSHKYIFLFLGSLIEGLNTMVLGGFLVSVGVINLSPISAIFILGYTLNGYIWYSVGYFAGAKPIDKWVRKDPKGQKIIERVEYYFNKYSGRAIILTKFTFSLTIATLIMAGSLKYNFKKFSLYNFLGSLGWVIATLGVGYFFGEGYKLLADYLRNFTYFVIFLAAGIALIYVIKLSFKSAFIKSLIAGEKLRFLSEKLKYGLDKFMSDKSEE